MGLEFDRPVGAKADEAELLYVSALHQSGDLRQDASINAEDIRHYLLSRHGIDVDINAVESIILNGNDKMDLISLVGMLFLPSFAKLAAPEDQILNLETVCSQIVKKVVDIILHDVTGDTDPKPLTISLVRKIFTNYGEEAVAQDDDLMQEIFSAATGGNKHEFLDEKSFLSALSHDLDSYDIHAEVTPTTNMSDVFGNCCDFNDRYVNKLKREILENESVFEEEGGEEQTSQNQQPTSFRSVYTGKGIDFLAGTYSCKYQVILVWTFFVFMFMGYVYPFVTDARISYSANCPDFYFLSSWKDNANPFGCSIVKSIIDWLLVFGAIIITGFCSVLAGSMGKKLMILLMKKFFFFLFSLSVLLLTGYEIEITGSALRERISRIFGLFFLIFLTFVGPAFSGIKDADMFVFVLRVITLVLGLLVILMRFAREIERQGWFSQSVLDWFDRAGFNGTANLHEGQLKVASASKIRRMMNNAFSVFTLIEETSVIKAYYGQGLANYEKHNDNIEYSGGVRWAWKRYWNYDLYTREGLWFSARFLASNFATVRNRCIMNV